MKAIVLGSYQDLIISECGFVNLGGGGRLVALPKLARELMAKYPDLHQSEVIEVEGMDGSDFKFWPGAGRHGNRSMAGKGKAHNKG